MLQLVILNSLAILGLHICFWEGMIFFKARKHLKRLPRVIQKPLFDCLMCMSSIWGLTFFLCWNGLSLNVIAMVTHVLAVCGCNVILDSCVHYWRRGGNRNSGIQEGPNPYIFEKTGKDQLK